MKQTIKKPGWLVRDRKFARSAADAPCAQRGNENLVAPAWPVGSAAANVPVATAPLAALLAGHILQDGELILLILKPSIWFIVLSTLRFSAVVLIGMLAASVFDDRFPGPPRVYYEFGAFLLAGRLMLSLLQWMSRYYILTDMRIVRVSGVFSLNIFDCPLRKVARTRILYTVRERLFRCGSIEIIPSDEEYPIGVWQTVSRPVHVNEQIVAAINRARHNRMGCS